MNTCKYSEHHQCDKSCEAECRLWDTIKPEVTCDITPDKASRLPELRERFPKIRGIKYEPDPSCRECHGSGVSPAKTLKSGTRIKDGPCACVFLGEHTREVKTALAGVARKALGENAYSPSSELPTNNHHG